jgi:hypothetical protein
VLPIVLLVSLAAAATTPSPSLAVAAPRAERLVLAPGSLALPRPAQRGEGRGGPPTLRLQDDYADSDDEPRYDDDERPRPHLLLSGWGGEALAHGGAGRSSSFYGGEVAWVFPSLDLGVAGSWYRALRDATRAWTPVVLTRVTQRFMTRRGLEAAFSLGFGAGRPAGWIGWYQVAIGMRVPLGSLYLGGELAFEQYDIIRLGAGLGAAF